MRWYIIDISFKQPAALFCNVVEAQFLMKPPMKIWWGEKQDLAMMLYRSSHSIGELPFHVTSEFYLNLTLQFTGKRDNALTQTGKKASEMHN